MITKKQFEEETKGKKPVSHYKCAAFWWQDYKIGDTIVRYSKLNTWDDNNGIQRSELE